MESQDLRLFLSKFSNKSSNASFRLKFDDSELIDNKCLNLIKCFFNENISLRIFYRASRDGYNCFNFYQKIAQIYEGFDLQQTNDNSSKVNKYLSSLKKQLATPKIIVVVRTGDGQLFGGFSDLKFEPNREFVKGTGNSFLFSLSQQTKHRCKNKQKEIFASPSSWGFGEGYDLTIKDQCNLYKNSYYNIGYTYEAHKGLMQCSENIKGNLRYTQKFLVDEIEAF